eukprot:UN31016
MYINMNKITNPTNSSTWKPKDEEPNKVYIHSFGRWKCVLDPSPFCIKLETFLRAANIPHEFVNDGPNSRNGKKPWIYHNGKTVDDSFLY